MREGGEDGGVSRDQGSHLANRLDVQKNITFFTLSTGKCTAKETEDLDLTDAFIA